MSKVFYTPQISLSSVLKFADCKPTVQSTDQAIAEAYLVNGYSIRSAWDTFNKGPTPPPFLFKTSVEDNLATYSIYFNEFTNANCSNFSCNLQCLTQNISIVGGTGNSTAFSYCQDNDAPVYHFQVNFSSDSVREGYPPEFNFTFEDALGNQQIINTQSISYIKPIKPNVGIIADESNKSIGFIGVNYRSVSNVDLSTGITAFLIQKATKLTKTNHQFLVNYESVNYDFHNGLFKDIEVNTGDIYSYRVKFKNSYNEESQWSDWTDYNYGLNTGVLPIDWTI